jgi:poly(rC)-binding protein 2/3/4
VVKKDEEAELAGKTTATTNYESDATVNLSPKAESAQPAADGGDTAPKLDLTPAAPAAAATIVETPSPAATQDESMWIHVRAVISSPEAATVIGKAGENVSNIRKLSNAKCTVSDYKKGAVERILTVSGVVDAVAKVSVCGPCVSLVSCSRANADDGCASLRQRHLD